MTIGLSRLPRTVVTPQAAAVPSITNRASAAAAEFDPNGANNTNITQVTAVAADFSIGATPALTGAFAGLQRGYTVSLTPIGAFAGTVALSCATTAPLATCTVAPASVSMSGGNTVTAVVTVTTVSTGMMVPRSSPWRMRPPGGFRLVLPWLLALFAMVLLTRLHKGLRRRMWSPAMARVALLVLFCTLATGCPVTSQLGTPSGTYSVTITATSGSLSHSTTVTFIVR